VIAPPETAPQGLHSGLLQTFAMTDRFYPLGTLSEGDVWKTSYEVQNEMHSFQRSAYPPGYAGHEPGARDKFGFSTPGPDAARLAAPHLALREEIDTQEPRRIHAVPRIQQTDERVTFQSLDVPEMERSYRSPLATASAANLGLPKVKSSPSLRTTTLRQQRLSSGVQPTTALEDEHFTYFVPKAMQGEPKDRLMSTSLTSLSKLHKSPEKKVNLPFAGDGTGFRTSCPDCDWWPSGAEHRAPSNYKRTYQAQPFFRMSPLQDPVQ